MTESILIIGVGSPYRCDDSVGLAILKQLRLHELHNVHLMERSGEGSDIMDIWQSYGHVILVDAVQSGSAPGTIHRIDANTEKVPTDFFHYSTHAFGVAEAVEMARTLGELPKHVLIYGIEGKDFEIGKEISAEIEKSAEQVVQQILDDIHSIREKELAHA
ncbi:MAG: hydrogenase maturation protease [Candidatus Marinimicrobia bacterium]|jgi:hydrogenase maturation protease|nr:hydrogenase maturation protease [Candidatus Neomarinimicrobiota bacterium]MDP6965854.1 hydrogenase maturation protease [Candidatus Neomarinimicrobiota bacterium]|tara:strand:- start:13093 stop:13575 length:483 start_codon:yes stop_codon:yes gene_type:complete